jgi:restriction system protein
LQFFLTLCDLHCLFSISKIENPENNTYVFDKDEKSLEGYRPDSSFKLNSVPVYSSIIDREIKLDSSSVCFEAELSEIRAILSISDKVPYDSLIDALTKSKPLVPPDVTDCMISIPSWMPWTIGFKEPSVSLPLYSGVFKFLNKFVVMAHQSELNRVDEAMKQYLKLVKISEYRNKKMENLYQKAKTLKEQKLESLKQDVVKLVGVYNASLQSELVSVSEIQHRISQRGLGGLLARVDLLLQTISLPSFVSREGKSSFDPDSGILIHEHKFPDVSSIRFVKYVTLKKGDTLKPANQSEIKEGVAILYPIIALRLLVEIIRLDSENIAKGIVINGWCDYNEKATGQPKRAYCLSVFATKEQVEDLNLSLLDPKTAFKALKGITSPSLDLVPIAPIMRINKNDSRFVEAKDVLSSMSKGENLAAMDWEDFEHLCRELFERAFASANAEVKITQASRDQGVDAIVFDNDPLRGGKIVIQAKRYTNIVDVSSVRDLYGTLINEGAIKGILVTTSYFGSESYAFAKDKPLTLINGNELLGLLEQHGYNFRIDLAEAKRLLSD